MAVVRTQLKVTMSGAPSIGTWDIYSGAWFNVSGSTTPNSAVRTLITNLFMGHSSTGAATSSTKPVRAGLVTGSAAGRLRAWELVSGLTPLIGEWTTAIALSNGSGSPLFTLPSQIQVCVGYKAPDQTKRQQGRSRFFIGPLIMPIATQSIAGGMRLTSTAVDAVATAALSCIEALALEGWTLAVHGINGTHDAVELYVDDVLDVQRKRRSWQNYQRRLDI